MKPQGNAAVQIHLQRHEAIHKGLRLRIWNKLELNIGTWDVHSLYRAEELKTLINQLSAYQADIEALQEIRWTGSAVLGKRGCTVFSSCDNKHRILGIGFRVYKRFRHLIIDFKPITPRICTLRMRGNFF
jgi:hypothetical protein